MRTRKFRTMTLLPEFSSAVPAQLVAGTKFTAGTSTGQERRHHVPAQIMRDTVESCGSSSTLSSSAHYTIFLTGLQQGDLRARRRQKGAPGVLLPARQL
jgi:hypothetical protein